MTPRFLSKVIVSAIDGTEYWMLEAPLVFYSKVLNETIWIPAGFVYDGHSIPRWLKLVPILSFFLKDKIAFPGSAALHDFGYRYKLWPRKAVDRLYLEALKAEKAGRLRRVARYLGVRVGGWWAYRKEPDDGERF